MTSSPGSAMCAAMAALAFGASTCRRARKFSSKARLARIGRQSVEEEFEKGIDAARCCLITQIGCSRCAMAMEGLKELQIRFQVMEITNEVGQPCIGPAQAYLTHMQTKTGSTELPQLHIRGGYGVAGLDNIFNALDDGTI